MNVGRFFLISQNQSGLLLLFVSSLLVLISLISYTFNTNHIGGVVSSIRLMCEVLLFLWFAGSSKAYRYIALLVVLTGTLNAVVVVFQIMEDLGLIAIGFSSLPGLLYSIDLEFMRKPGFLNGFQISSLMSVLAVIILMRLNSNRNQLSNKLILILILINIVSLPFGSRTLLLIVPFMFIQNPRILLGLLAVLILVILSSNQLLYGYFEERLLPIIKVVLTLDAGQDYSSKDTFTHYRMPFSLWELMFGNGADRYEIGAGGMDPTLSRWLLQSGVIAMLIIVVFISLLVTKVLYAPGIENKMLAVGLVLSTIKGELVTSLGVAFLLLILYQKCFVSRKELGI